MAKMSKIWMAWVASHGKQHVYIRGLHDKYGDVVRIGEAYSLAYVSAAFSPPF